MTGTVARAERKLHVSYERLHDSGNRQEWESYAEGLKQGSLVDQLCPLYLNNENNVGK